MERWSKEKACKWWSQQKWAVGCNYVPSDAVNDVEMWMNNTFNPELIESELRRAHEIGFNSVRVFLPFIVWKHERDLFESNFDLFLSIAGRNDISVMPVLFDDCAFDHAAEPYYGIQPEPIPGVHNSRWVPSPGFIIQDDPSQEKYCQEYIHEMIGKHRDDTRILAWDLFNEPGNTQRKDCCLPLLKNVFHWARQENPSQPLTVALWCFDDSFSTINTICEENSDIISIHAYTSFERSEALITQMSRLERPIFISEWLCRSNGNTYETHLPLFFDKKIGIWQWGLFNGKTQTHLSWATWEKPETQPKSWQHDLLNADGSPYSIREIELIKKYTTLSNTLAI